MLFRSKAPFDPVEYGATPITLETPALRAFAERQCARDPEWFVHGAQAVDRECRRLLAHYGGQWCHHLIQADVDALVAAGRLMDFTHVPRTPEQVEMVKAKLASGGNSWLPEPNGYTPTADEVNGWSIGGMGHDAINAWICRDARLTREGVTERTCAVCGGSGNIWSSAEAAAACEAWEPTEPPEGEGFQLWETTSEGSPISPVFATLEELCDYAAANCSTFGSQRTTAHEWRRMLDRMLDAGFVCHTEKTDGGPTLVFL